MITNNEPSASGGLLDDLSSKPRKAPEARPDEEALPERRGAGAGAGGVERLGAKRRRTTPVKGRRQRAGTSKNDADADEAAPSSGPANRARDAAQGAVACDDDDDDEVTATFRGEGSAGDGDAHASPGAPRWGNGGGGAHAAPERRAPPQWPPPADGAAAQGDAQGLSAFGRRPDRDAGGARKKPRGAAPPLDGADRAAGAGAFAARDACAVPDGTWATAPGYGGAGPGTAADVNGDADRMTTTQIRGIQERTYDLLFNFWSRRTHHQAGAAGDVPLPPDGAGAQRANGEHSGR